MKSRTIPEMVNSAQTRKKHEITKSIAPSIGQSKLTRAKEENMRTSTKDQIKGSFHEVKGTIKEEVGKATNNRNLTVEGKAEKKAGKVQQQIGHAKETVAKLRGKLAQLKTR
jgi:uncharacterized protein YjbJ (UPF0337 family)